VTGSGSSRAACSDVPSLCPFAQQMVARLVRWERHLDSELLDAHILRRSEGRQGIRETQDHARRNIELERNGRRERIIIGCRIEPGRDARCDLTQQRLRWRSRISRASRRNRARSPGPTRDQFRTRRCMPCSANIARRKFGRAPRLDVREVGARETEPGNPLIGRVAQSRSSRSDRGTIAGYGS